MELFFQISLLGERLECLMVLERFGDNLVEIEKKLTNFKHVCDMLIKGICIRSAKDLFKICYLFNTSSLRLRNFLDCNISLSISLTVAMIILDPVL